jgi:predicted GNAT family acetyltransferase
MTVESRVTDNPGERRFEVYLGDALAGFAGYQLAPGRIVFTHTEIDPRFEGHGLGSRLASGALDSARERELAVVPRCPFIAAYIARHREYADLVAA